MTEPPILDFKVNESMYAQMALSAYRGAGVASEVETASPFRLVQILMDKTVEKLNLAVARARTGEVVERRRAVSRAIELIDELRVSLKPQGDSPIAAQLTELYTHMINRLLHSTNRDDGESIGAVAELMATIKSAWDQLPEVIDKLPQKARLEGYIDVV